MSKAGEGHWLSKVVELLSADTHDLRELARRAGGDPRYFYKGARTAGLDLRGQDLRGMEFTGLDLSEVLVDQRTRMNETLSPEESPPALSDPWPVIPDRPTSAIIEVTTRSARLTIFGKHSRVATHYRSLANDAQDLRTASRLVLSDILDLGKLLLSKDIRKCEVYLSVPRHELPLDQQQIELEERDRLEAIEEEAAIRSITAAFKSRLPTLDVSRRGIDSRDQSELVGLGVLAAIPNANGFVADLSRRTLRMCRISHGEEQMLNHDLFPVDFRVEKGGAYLERVLSEVRKTVRTKVARGAKPKALYVTGEIFHLIAMRHLKNSQHPVKALHQYEFRPQDRIDTISVPGNRFDSELLTGQKAILALCEALNLDQVTFSEYGLAEGLWSLRRKRVDALIAECDRTARHGQGIPVATLRKLREWAESLFPEDRAFQRICAAAALLADVGNLVNHPQRVLDGILRAPFVALSHADRAALALALYYRCTLKETPRTHPIAMLCGSKNIKRVRLLGATLRIGIRFAEATPRSFQKSTIYVNSDDRLIIEAADIDQATVQNLMRGNPELAGAISIRRRAV